LEEALALQRLIDEFELTHQQAADAVGRSRAAVSNLLRLLELSGELRQWLRERKLDMGHARALLPLPPALQLEAARQVLLRGLSARETEDLARRLQQQETSAAPARARPADPNIQSLQNAISSRCKTTCPSGWARGSNCATTPPARAGWSSITTVWTSWTGLSPA